MENIPNNKMDFFKSNNVKVDVKKSNDILGKDAVKVKDIIGRGAGEKDTLINKMSDIFPPASNGNDDLLS